MSVCGLRSVRRRPRDRARQGVEWHGVRRRRGGNPPQLAMRRSILVAAFALGSPVVFAGEAPEERTEQAATPAVDQPSSAGERKGLAPRKKEPAPDDEASKPMDHSRVSLEDATAIVRQAYGGRVVSAAAARARPEPARRKESGYRVRVDVDGRVKTVFVDARGRIHENAEY